MPRRKRRTLASRADRFDLYQRSVQDPGDTATTIDEIYARLRRRNAVALREDFCGAAAVACAWVRRRADTTAVALDIDPEALAWGRGHNVGALDPGARRRIRLVRRDVLGAGPALGRPDVIVAFNNSWAVFDERSTLLRYFRGVRRALAREGVFILQLFGGRDGTRILRRSSRRAGATYIWEQSEFNAVTSVMHCAIHYRFRDGSSLSRAFEYRWRVWGLTETRDVLLEAGFADTAVLWPVADRRGRPLKQYSATKKAPGGRVWGVYIVAVP